MKLFLMVHFHQQVNFCIQWHGGHSDGIHRQKRINKWFYMFSYAFKNVVKNITNTNTQSCLVMKDEKIYTELASCEGSVPQEISKKERIIVLYSVMV